LAETMKMPGSLELPASRAVGFYAVIGAATLGGAVLAVLGLDPMAMLFWAAVVNGVVAVPIMFATVAVVAGRRARGVFGLPRWTEPMGWLAALLMTLAVAALGWLSLVGAAD
jgi:Mn2+/Fe2+ NRAMP family transporter